MDEDFLQEEENDENLKIVKRVQVEELMRKANLGINNIAADYLERLDQKVQQLILDSLKRAKENNRRTVMGRDI